MLNNVMRMLTELLDKKTVTASYIATLLDVTPRTIYRYVDTLSSSGVPVYSIQGRGGGICIGEEYKLNSAIFARSEMEFLRDMASNVDNTQDKAKYNNIISKIGSVNTPLSHNVTSSSLYIQPDPYANDQLHSKITTLENAINNTNEVSISYVGRSDISSRRTIRPLNFVLNNNEWYIYAYCTKQKDMRIFKLSRITKLTTTDIKFSPITDYAKTWKFAWNDDKELINIILEVTPNSKYDVEEWLGIGSVTTSNNGGLIANATRYLDDELVYKVLSYGKGVRVVEPKTLITRLTQIITSMQDYQQ